MDDMKYVLSTTETLWNDYSIAVNQELCDQTMKYFEDASLPVLDPLTPERIKYYIDALGKGELDGEAQVYAIQISDYLRGCAWNGEKFTNKTEVNDMSWRVEEMVG